METNGWYLPAYELMGDPTQSHQVFKANVNNGHPTGQAVTIAIKGSPITMDMCSARPIAAKQTRACEMFLVLMGTWVMPQGFWSEMLQFSRHRQPSNPALINGTIDNHVDGLRCRALKSLH